MISLIQFLGDFYGIPFVSMFIVHVQMLDDGFEWVGELVVIAYSV